MASYIGVTSSSISGEMYFDYGDDTEDSTKLPYISISESRAG